MGGERETTVDVADRTGGDKGGALPGFSVEHAGQTNRTLRIHENAGQVHFHDDNANPKIKVAVPVAEMWKAWEKLRYPIAGTPVEWKYIDTVNNSVVEIEVSSQEFQDTQGITTWQVRSNCRVKRATVDVTFQNLNNFMKKK